MSVFSSEYQNKLFIPFIQNFLATGGNPWNFFLHHSLPLDAFPYPPFMLYLLSIAYWPLTFLDTVPFFLQNFAFGALNLCADFLIFFLLLKYFTNYRRIILFLYFCSPLVLFASYIHSQLDLIPTSVLFLSIFLLLRGKITLSSICFGIAISLKFHVFIILPCLFVYLWKNQGIRPAFLYLVYPILIYFFIGLPYLFSEGYFQMVLNNPKQASIFDSYYQLGNQKIYVAILALIVLFLRFAHYRKINHDLLLSFTTITFSVFVLLVPSGIAWYLWILPFLCIFCIKYLKQQPKVLYLISGFYACYLLYFLFFHQSEYQDIIFLQTPIDLKWVGEKERNLAFTLLEAILVCIVLGIYRIGVKSNEVYRQSTCFIIGIGGDSASGKSTILSYIQKLLGDKMLPIEADGYHRWQRGDHNWEKFTHLDPKANTLHDLAQDILALKAGKKIYHREYLHQTGTFSEPKELISKDFVLLSGLHPFYLPIMRKNIDFKIFMDPSPDLRTFWKTHRDTTSRGYIKEKVLEQIKSRENDTNKFILPQKQFADLVIQYFPKKQKEQEISEHTEIFIKLILSANIFIEDILQKIEAIGIPVTHEYELDLSNQSLLFTSIPYKQSFDQIARTSIENLDNLIQDSPEWLNGTEGLLQLFFLIILSDKMKES